MITYLLSWIPSIAIDYVSEWYNDSFIINYININPAIFQLICDWAILSILIMDTSLQFLSQLLTTKIFQFEQSIQSQSQIRREIRSRNTSLADKISLSSINSLLSLLLNILRPFVPSFIYNIIHDGLYQVVIFGSFLFISPVLGSHILGYLLPIYTSILALHNLQELQHKIALWNNNQRQDLITPQISQCETSPIRGKNGGSHLRSRAKNGTSSSAILSPPRENVEENTKENGQSWSSSLWNLIPTNMFSFTGNDDLEKAQRKRQEMHKEADYVIGTIVDRLKYWIVFATLQWIYYFIGEQIGLQFYIPLWNHAKFALILWIQLPYVPYSALKLYQFVILPIRILDITHIDHNTKKMDDYIPNSTDNQLSVSVSPIQRKSSDKDKDNDNDQDEMKQNHRNGTGRNGKINQFIEQPSGTKMSLSFQNLLNSDDESEENS